MKTATRLMMMILPTLLFACGGGTAKIGGKEGAAQAVHALTGATKTGADRAAGAFDTTDVNVTCAKGGTAKLSGFSTTVDISGGASIIVKYTLTLTNCGLATSAQGDAVFSGVASVEQSVVTDASGVKVAQHFTGDLVVGGAFSDTLALDVEESVDITRMGTSGTVSIVLDGTVTTSTESHTFNGAVTITGGSITVAASK